MAGFIRRFGSFPSESVLTAIEGVNIIDLAPPGSISGVGTGFAAVVGEFQDMTYAVDVNPTTGAVSTNIVPVQVFSAKDLSDKGGLFDSTIGNFGADGGNGFLAIRNKTFSQLAIVPVNLCSTFGMRLWRSLPTNVSATVAEPVVPVTGAVVAAGSEFRDAPDVLYVGARQQFSNAAPIATGTDGSTTTAASAVVQNFTSASGDWVNRAAVGDAVVLGVIGAAGALGSNADTYRIQAITSSTVVVLEKQDGSSFVLDTDTNVPWRHYPAAVADTGGANNLAAQAGYLVPVRPITDGQGTGSSAADGNWSVDTNLAAFPTQPAATATAWSPLSGLAGRTGPTGVIAYVAATQAPNAANDAAIDALYSAAFTAMENDTDPSDQFDLIWAARRSSSIRTAMQTYCNNASALGSGRSCVIAPELDLASTTAFTTVIGDSDPGVGARRDERVWYSWPPVRTFIPEAVGSVIATADGLTTDDGILDVAMDGYLVSLLSNLAPERNPGESTKTTRVALQTIAGLARNVPNLNMNNYITMRDRGIAGIRIDRRVGPVIQSGVTSSLVSGEKNIARRRMADFIQDSIADRLVTLAKLPLTESWKDSVLSEITAFLDGLLSEDNPAAQRIAGFNPVDGVSGNTPELEAKGIYVVIIQVRTLASADFITIQTEIGEGVVLTSDN